jgi:hypothetical protein
MGEGEERRVIVARHRLKPLALVADKLAHALLRLAQPMILPSRLTPETDAPRLGAGEQLLELFGRVIDGERPDQGAALPAALDAVAAAPRDQPRYLVAADFGDELVLAEEPYQSLKLLPGVGGPGVMLADFLPIAPGHVVEAQRGRGRALNGDERPRLLALGALYRFGLPLGRGLG